MLCLFLNFFLVLLGIAWYTLLERKFLRYSQWRVGPNKLVFIGILQPMIDGIKLIFKEFNFMYLRLLIYFFFFPLFLFFLIVILWSILPRTLCVFNYFNDLIFFVLFLGLRIFFIILLRLFSNSKFASLGSIRAASQSVSFEIRINFILLASFCLLNSLSIFFFFKKFYILDIFLVLFWWVSCLIECNRAPFDFAEGERELIRGFNVEFSSIGFVFIFLSEYGIILFFSIMTTLVYFNNFFFFFFFFSIFILIRSSYPRYRYDKIINFCWVIVLPFSIFFIFFFKII
jgi:NADH-ubiquinone oxidoreductase chain 1